MPDMSRYCCLINIPNTVEPNQTSRAALTILINRIIAHIKKLTENLVVYELSVSSPSPSGSASSMLSLPRFQMVLAWVFIFLKSRKHKYRIGNILTWVSPAVTNFRCKE